MNELDDDDSGPKTPILNGSKIPISKTVEV